MGVQFILSPAGEEMAVLPRAEYESLLAAAAQDDDEADTALFKARMAELEQGTAHHLPEDVSALMLRGHSLLTALRKSKEMTQTYVCFKTNISQGYLSDLESGKRGGSIEILKLLAKCYDAPLAWLTDEAGT